MKKLKGKKKLLIGLAALVLAAAIGAGAVFANRSGGETVGVYPFDYIGMTEYWGDNQESYGPVTSDKIQTVFLSDTQTVTEILVKEGDTVKKGDMLMSFDTTLSDLSLERKRLAVEKVKLQLQDAQDELNWVRNQVAAEMRPTQPEAEADLGAELVAAYQISGDTDYDGSTRDKALICWMQDASGIDTNLLHQLWQKAVEYQRENFMAGPGSSASAVPETQTPTVPETTADPTTAPDETTASSVSTEPAGEETEPTEPVETFVPPTEFFVVFKVTEGNRALAGRLVWQGLQVKRSDSGNYSFQFFEAGSVEDHTIAGDGSVPEVDNTVYYSARELAQMREALYEEIEDLEFQLKMAEAEYKIMQREVSDGNVYAEVDGVVVSLLPEEEARMSRQPVIKVSGGGGFNVEGSISELEKDNLKIGQEVTINDWNTGMIYTGEVVSIGDFPSSRNGWNGMGNPNASYYPFQVFIDGSADLQTGSYVSMTYSTSQSENGIYLRNPFVRTEGGQSYVFVLGSGGRLEKRDVVTGKSLWGSYTEILSGITAEDLIAFPYGKNVKDGAPAEEKDISELYSY